MTPVAALVAEMSRLSGLIDNGVTALSKAGHDLADAEHAYRIQKAAAWSQAPDGTVPEREAWVNQRTADERRTRDKAEATRVAALEALRSRRTQLSALQTVANAYREDAAFSRTGPQLEGAA